MSKNVIQRFDILKNIKKNYDKFSSFMLKQATKS